MEALVASLQAIEARIQGEFDHPSLQAIGGLSSSVVDDILYITHRALAANGFSASAIQRIDC